MDMSTPRTVLVVAPESDLRRSLTFMLSAEGFTVETANTWPHDCEPDVHAVIVDDHAMPKGFTGDDALVALGHKLVVLSGRSRAYPRLPAATIIHKPLLDHVVLNTLKGFPT